MQLTAYQAIYANGSTSSNLPPGIQFAVHSTAAPGPGGQVGVPISKAQILTSGHHELQFLLDEQARFLSQPPEPVESASLFTYKAA